MRPAIDTGKLVRWYDFQAPFYRLWRHRLGAALARRVVQEAAGPLPGSRALDAACGTGLFAVALARALPAVHVVGVDLSAGMLALAADEARRAGVANLRFGRANVAHLPFIDGSFELVVAAGLLPNINDWPPVLREFGRVLQPRGRLFIVEADRTAMGPVARCGFWLMILGFRAWSFLAPRFRFVQTWDLRSSTVDRPELEHALEGEGLRTRTVLRVDGHLVFRIEKGAGA